MRERTAIKIIESERMKNGENIKWKNEDNEMSGCAKRHACTLRELLRVQSRNFAPCTVDHVYTSTAKHMLVECYAIGYVLFIPHGIFTVKKYVQTQKHTDASYYTTMIDSSYASLCCFRWNNANESTFH